MNALIGDLKELTPEFHMEIFGPFAANAVIDMSKLVLAGHSYGGITAITTAARMDPDQ